jgi:tripartite-type tricarboxylate transporter receptor subunit TctC
MNKDDEILMAQHSITCEPKMIYSYKSFKYDNLKDAVRYAELDKKRKIANESLPK